jgi:small redox-active disulfide protein 2
MDDSSYKEDIMKQIKILGPGCRRCEQLAATTKEAADQLGIDYELEKVKDIAKLADYGVMMTPGLVVDGEVKSQGKVLSLDEIKAMLT